MQKRIAEFIKSHRSVLAAVTGIIALYLVLFALGITCPIKYLTGISCPGCGMSRACFNALTFNFAAAFSFHPLWIALPFAVFFLSFFHIKKMRTAFRITLGVCIAAMIAVYVIRLVSDSTVVVFAVKDGFIYKAVCAVINIFE
jgi:hypothetical protein